MHLPDGAARPRRTDSARVKALARADRRRHRRRTGEVATFAACAEREGIAPSSMSAVLRLTLPAPDIVEAILDGRRGPKMTMALEPFPEDWQSKARNWNDRSEPYSLSGLEAQDSLSHAVP